MRKHVPAAVVIASMATFLASTAIASPTPAPTKKPASAAQLLNSAGNKSMPPAANDHGKPTAGKPEASKPETGKLRANGHAVIDDKADKHDDPKDDHKDAAKDEAMAPAAVLQMLAEGNERWVKNTPTAPNTDPARRASVAENGQKPMVTVLTCADSRLPVERMFDRGVGEVFVVRVAGNVIGDELTGTIEYGLGHLKTPLLVVMGHTKCGAVAAAASNADVHGKVRTIVQDIAPAVERARQQNPGADVATLTSAAIRENVWQTIFDLLRTSDDVRSMVASGQVQVVGAIADISTGKVEFMGPHPWQSELVRALNAQPAGSSTTTTSATATAEPAKEHGGH